MVFNLEKRCIQLLDDGVERESPTALWEQYNFGSAPELLFKPCNSNDGSCFAYSVNGMTFEHDPIIRLHSEETPFGNGNSGNGGRGLDGIDDSAGNFENTFLKEDDDMKMKDERGKDVGERDEYAQSLMGMRSMRLNQRNSSVNETLSV